ncbi:molybdenum cofactor biosynthesis protein C [Planctopirus limnophila DSM 3776]|uniref:Cyclic pyranopterin monophosphate synthase n=1 Tax=Planctopirus limnophila (strain ATCC 43296 / DSM 3776 / IFAM 1008 / Mu 290) TaxID=521674 RepID=D5SN57_PLAL2|nr:cyclic pyranopterin monophosphate synthase MoaC [Planctopirus limnophila]ADG65984.1 molybdenum cofactor biosynthesis protein C [Planctopirus limnophila DSM 3776]
MTDLTHFDSEGHSRMVNVGHKPVTERTATAEGFVTAHPETITRMAGGGTAKGNVLEVARLAGIMAAKKTADLIPLCHPLGLDSVEIEFSFTSPDELRIVATASLTAKTGVEMEALTAVSIAALTVYDMCKSIDKAMTIGPIRLLSKTGGKSGSWSAPS